MKVIIDWKFCSICYCNLRLNNLSDLDVNAYLKNQAEEIEKQHALDKKQEAAAKLSNIDYLKEQFKNYINLLEHTPNNYTQEGIKRIFDINNKADLILSEIDKILKENEMINWESEDKKAIEHCNH